MNEKITRILYALLFVALLITSPHAQPAAITQQSPEDRIALYQALLDLTNPWTVMCVAAHPDDEDGTSLIVMRRKYGAHTVSLFSTFGEGGQNAIGPELYEELGTIRARETMAAAEIQGSEPHFLGLKDFGYSKTRDEAFKFWGHEEALRRMVLEIRKLRPDVIITNHSTTSNDHGQHQATALMVVEAFDAAADPNKFPEQLKDGVTTWQVQRLFVRARGQNPDRQGGGQPIVTIDPNERDPVRGVVYAEEALRALQQHATQGPWPKTFAEYANRFRAFSGQQGGTPGQLPMIRYALVREAKGAGALPKDPHNFLDGLMLPDRVATDLQAPTINGKPLTEFVNERTRLFDALEAASKRFNTPTEPAAEPRRGLMLQRFEFALQATSGISTRLIPRTSFVIPGEPAKFDLVISNHGDAPAHVGLVSTGQGKNGGAVALLMSIVADKTVAPGQEAAIALSYSVPKDIAVTIPHAQHLYDENYLGRPFAAGGLVNVNGVGFSVFGFKLIDVVPPVEIADVSPSSVVISPQTMNTARTLTLRVSNHGSADVNTSIEGIAAADSSDRLRKRTTQSPLTLGRGETREVNIVLPVEAKTEMRLVTRRITIIPRTATPIEDPPPAAKPGARILLRTADKSSNEVSVPITYANARITPNLRVGYIRGFDFSLPNALDALGVESKELSVDEVRTADLSRFTSIIVDNRVYESKPELIAANQKLLDYANAGGNLIVFYHKSDEWNPDPRRNRPQLAPYKLILGNERITDENAPITFVEPDHPLLNTPNKLNQEDFKDWIQERGLYYPREWDPQFHALLESRDFNEPPLKGGLLVADYGRGHYIYTSMVWYRQLRAGVPGAYRMLANMISYGRN